MEGKGREGKGREGKGREGRKEGRKECPCCGAQLCLKCAVVCR